MATTESYVDAWLASQRPDMNSEELAGLLARAVRAIWDRARVTLGEVTVEAVFQRVWSTSLREHPVLASFKHGGFLRVDARELAGAAPESLRLAVRFVLADLLTVIGRLTAEILTPGLQAALQSVHSSGAAQEPPPRSRTSN